MTLCEHTEWKRDAILKVAETSSNQGVSYLPYITGVHHLLDVSIYLFCRYFCDGCVVENTWPRMVARERAFATTWPVHEEKPPYMLR